VSFESLASFLLHTGETDEFASALAASDERTATHHRLQLKTLLFGMGETFRVLTLRRDEQK
jgi:SAM-dependent MidA family methyltransferase